MSITPLPHNQATDLTGMGCPTCYTQQYPECTQSLTIAGGFAAGVGYLVVVKDQFGNLYRTSATGTNNGELVIPAADFPQGLFSRFAGAFEFIFYAAGGCAAFEPTLCGYKYPCVLLSFVQTTDSSSVDADAIIGCCTDEPGPAQGSIVLSVKQECRTEPGQPAPFIAAQLTVTGGTGTYSIQLFNGTSWDVITTVINQPADGTITLAPFSGFDLMPHTYRAVTGNLVSNEVTIQLHSCLETLEIQGINYICDGASGIIHADVLIQNPSGNNLLFQVYLGGMWVTILTMLDPLPGIQGTGILYTVPAGNQIFRFYDEGLGIASPDFETFISGCAASYISLQIFAEHEITLELNEVYGFDIGYYYLTLQVSDDGVSGWSAVEEIIIPASPITQAGFTVPTATAIIDGKYYRVAGLDSDMLPLYSTIMQYNA